MKVNKNVNTEFEEILKNKMDELASSVDCFNKISRKVFPDNNNNFSDDEFIINEIENVTGKKKHFRFLPTIVVAAAFVLCIGLLRQNQSFMNFVYSTFDSDANKCSFREVMNEITEETKENSYTYIDCTLENYIANYLLIDPINGCPFEQNDRENINVRIFTKYADGIPTNQVYAVEYEGSYDEGNYIAVADSKAKLSNDEIEKLNSTLDFPCLDDDMLEFADKRFPNVSNNCFVNDENKNISLGGFSANYIYKYDDTIYPITIEVIYYCENGLIQPKYNYDLNASYIENGSEKDFNTEHLNEAWNNVIYFNDNSALATENTSNFTKTNDFDSVQLTGDFNRIAGLVTPYASIGETSLTNIIYSSTVDYCVSNEYMLADSTKIAIPINSMLYQNFKIYFPLSNSSIYISSENNFSCSFNNPEIQEFVDLEQAKSGIISSSSATTTSSPNENSALDDSEISQFKSDFQTANNTIEEEINEESLNENYSPDYTEESFEDFNEVQAEKKAELLKEQEMLAIEQEELNKQNIDEQP